jgi:hypothetical protein
VLSKPLEHRRLSSDERPIAATRAFVRLGALLFPGVHGRTVAWQTGTDGQDEKSSRTKKRPLPKIDDSDRSL